MQNAAHAWIALCSLLSACFCQYLAFEAIWMRALSVFAIAILFNAIIILLMFFDVGQEMEVGLEQADIALDDSNLKKESVESLFAVLCHVREPQRTTWSSFIERLAFCFLSALTIVAGLVLTSLLTNSPADQTERVIREDSVRPESDKSTFAWPKGR